MEIKIRLEGGMMPERKSALAAAYDLYVPRDTVLRDGRQVLDLGFSMELPRGFCAVVQPRSGFSARGMEVTAEDGAPVRADADVIIGLVDEDYRGHVGVIVDARLHGRGRLLLKKGTRIAQMRIAAVPDTVLRAVDGLDMTADRGGGFGHTGSY